MNIRKEAVPDGLVKQLGRLHTDGLARVPQREQRHVLLSTLHAADVSAVDAHALCHSLLAQPCCEPVAAQVRAKGPAYVHPQEGCPTCISALRTIIRGGVRL